MDTKTLEQANNLYREINNIESFIHEMDYADPYGYRTPNQFLLSKELKDLIRPILKQYQEKLLLEIKNL